MCADLGIQAKKSRPCRPQTNGKIERFRRALANGRAYACFYESEGPRYEARLAYLHTFNHHRISIHASSTARTPLEDDGESDQLGILAEGYIPRAL